MATTTALILMTALVAGGRTGIPTQEPTQTPAPQTQTYTDPTLGLSFVYPSTWTPLAAEPPKGKKPVKPEDQPVRFSIPTGAGNAPAELTIVRASFSGPPETWQQIQADSNRNLKREVDRQWQQEILGVPLLLTRISYNQDGVAQTTLTGLLYNAAAYKLLIRLTGPSANFDAAQFEFTQAMETLRTTNDTLPTTQEPDKPIAPPPGPPTPDSKHTLFKKPTANPKISPVTLAVVVGDRKMILRVPLGWTLEKLEGDTATLRNPALTNPVSVKLYAVATAPRPVDALTTSTNATLDEFKVVTLREDTPAGPNKAGNLITAVWRRGEGASGPFAALDAVAIAGDYYAVFSYRPSPGPAFAAERKVVQAMLDRVGLEPAP